MMSDTVNRRKRMAESLPEIKSPSAGDSAGSSESSNPSSEGDGSPVGMLLTGGGSVKGEDSEGLAGLSHGSISVIGRRRTVDGAVTVAAPETLPGEFSFFAVYDGHGGPTVANACSDVMHKLLAKEINGVKLPKEPSGSGSGRVVGGVDWENVMVACFAKMDQKLNWRASESAEITGSAAVVVIVGKEEVVVANSGDSRVVLCRGGIAMPLSRDHKPNRPEERDIVEAAGGRVQGALATSISIGDKSRKPCVISKPEVTWSKRIESDDFLIIASAGLWSVLSNYLACEVAKKCLDGPISMGRSPTVETAAKLAGLAVAKGSKDNISVIVVQLAKPRRPIS